MNDTTPPKSGPAQERTQPLIGAQPSDKKTMRRNESAFFTQQAVSCTELSKFCFTPYQAEEAFLATIDESERQTSSLENNQMISLHESVLKRTESRMGRSNQRWEEDPQSGLCYRLTTGTVPIMNDGRILFISANGKPEWILPKGGWEKDETEVESALRETFEEAGIIGRPGPKLQLVEYETRKAKKAKKDRESREAKAQQQNSKNITRDVSTSSQISQEGSAPSSSNTSVIGASDDEGLAGIGNLGKDETIEIQASNTSSSFANQHPKGENTMNNLADKETHSGEQSGQNIPPFSNPNTTHNPSQSPATVCTHVRMSLYLMYVLEVRPEWPESDTRLRKMLDIDSAIEMLSNRPEFQVVLKEVKKRNLHQVAPAVARAKTNLEERNKNHMGTTIVTEERNP